MDITGGYPTVPDWYLSGSQSFPNIFITLSVSFRVSWFLRITFFCGSQSWSSGFNHFMSPSVSSLRSSFSKPFLKRRKVPPFLYLCQETWKASSSSSSDSSLHDLSSEGRVKMSSWACPKLEGSRLFVGEGNPFDSNWYVSWSLGSWVTGTPLSLVSLKGLLHWYLWLAGLQSERSLTCFRDRNPPVRQYSFHFPNPIRIQPEEGRSPVEHDCALRLPKTRWPSLLPSTCTWALSWVSSICF